MNQIVLLLVLVLETRPSDRGRGRGRTGDSWKAPSTVRPCIGTMNPRCTTCSFAREASYGSWKASERSTATPFAEPGVFPANPNLIDGAPPAKTTRNAQCHTRIVGPRFREQAHRHD